jgi:hypothetical protein
MVVILFTSRRRAVFLKLKKVAAVAFFVAMMAVLVIGTAKDVAASHTNIPLAQSFLVVVIGFCWAARLYEWLSRK